MKKLKILLRSKKIYVFLFLCITLYIIISTKLIKYQSLYENGNVEIIGVIENYSITKNKIKITISAKEDILGTYYCEKKCATANIKIGSKMVFKGTLKSPSKNTIPNTFDYETYLYNNKIYKQLTISEMNLLSQDANWLQKIKNNIYERAISNEYLQLFIIGDKSSLDLSLYESFKNTGVAHLLAVSGMHVSVFIVILNKIFGWLKSNKKEIIISVFLIFYAYLVNFSASILRVIIFYIINLLNKRFDLALNNKETLYLTAIVILMINPFSIYQVGFLYSFVTVYSIIITSKYQRHKYFLDIFIISFWTLLFSLPITVNLNFQINLIAFLSNLILIPYISFILYPLSLICFVVPILLPVFVFLTNIMEFIVSFLNKIQISVINIPNLNIIQIVIYYSLILLIVRFNSKKLFGLLIVFLTFSIYLPKFDSVKKLVILDVGQGDLSILISSNLKDITMIDTGGVIGYQDSSYSIMGNVIKYLNSIGITKITTLILTHGDYDHMGDAINLVENFKVEKVIFNNGEYNNLELELIKVLEKKNIPYYQNIKELNIGENKLYFLNNKIYDNENDNSIVLYTKINNHKLLLMGDAGVEVEQDLIDKYNLEDIDILKVGHHGSKTSTSHEFIDYINPKYSIISVGKNNRYGHPNNEVLEILDESNIYRTDQDGSVMFKFKQDKLKVSTCPP